MRVYVASKWENKERTRQVMDQLRAARHIITHDWTMEAPGSPSNVNAACDRAGVVSADAFVGIFEEDLKYSGALTEMGIAVAMGIPIYILGNAIDSNIFLALPQVRRGIDELLVKEATSA